MVYDIKGKVVLVTGAANGIGAAIVRSFLNEGAKHAAILDLAEDAGKALAAELNTKYGAGSAKFFKVDVTKDDQFFNAFDVTIAEQGYIDLVINNAGLMNDSRPVYKKAVEVNVTAVMTGTIKAIDVMRKDKGGKGGAVINMSSVAGLHQFFGLPIYFATKSAVIQFSNCIGKPENYNRTGVRVITICFGPTDTALLTKAKLGTIDDDDLDTFVDSIKDLGPKQKQESAVRGVLDSYKFGDSGSTWLANKDRPTVDITKDITAAYDIMSNEMMK